MKTFVKSVSDGIITVIVGQLLESDEILYTDYRYIRGRGNKYYPIRGKMVGETYQAVLPKTWDGQLANSEVLRWDRETHQIFNASSVDEVVENIVKENSFAFTDFSALSDRAFEGLCKTV